MTGSPASRVRVLASIDACNHPFVAPRGIDRSRSRIVALCEARDDFAVYHDRAFNAAGTPLMFRGSLAECFDWRRS